MKFLSLAKPDAAPVSPKTALPLQQSIVQITAQLEALASSQRVEASHWANVAASALEAGSDATNIVASLRQKQCQQTLNSASRCAEVLGTVCLKLQKAPQA